MYSIRRRSERFKIIQVYKIKEKQVTNISKKYGLTFKMNGRHGCKCDVPIFPIRGRARNATDSSFAWTACSLWNSLPKCIRNITGKHGAFFKKKLYKVLAFYPDKPRCSKSNSLCDHYRNVEIRNVIASV